MKTFFNKLFTKPGSDTSAPTHPRNKIYRIWTQKDGTRIKMEDMATRHILNCIKMCERNGAHNLIPELQAELADREQTTEYPQEIIRHTQVTYKRGEEPWRKPARLEEELPEDSIDIDPQLGL